MTLTVANSPRLMAGANRAIDEQAIRRRGPFAAIMAAPTEATAVRRASLVLGMHRWSPCPPVLPSNVVAALGTWRLLHGEER